MGITGFNNMKKIWKNKKKFCTQIQSEKMDIGIENKLQVNLGEDIEANVCRTRIFIKSLIKILHSNAVQGVYLSKFEIEGDGNGRRRSL